MNKTEIANSAIGYIGTGKSISSIEENSKEALACNTYINESISVVLSSYQWSFTRKSVSLILHSELDKNEYEWLYAYDVPEDVSILEGVYGREVRSDDLTGGVIPFETRAVVTKRFLIPFVYNTFNGIRKILTNSANASIVYYTNDVSLSHLPREVLDSIAKDLAIRIAPQLATYPTSKVRGLKEDYMMTLNNAVQIDFTSSGTTLEENRVSKNPFASARDY